MHHAWLANLNAFGSIGHFQIWQRVRDHNISRLYLSATQATAENLGFVRQQGIECGVVRDPIWTQAGAVDLARLCDADLARTASGNAQCAVMVDVEAMFRRGSQYMIDFLKEWRALRPSRVTSWTTEPNQGGTISLPLVGMIGADPNLVVLPQTYDGNMAPYGTVDWNRADIVERGVPRARVAAFYDGAALPAHWDGCAFTLERLPL
jgi:hypothetical protein